MVCLLFACWLGRLMNGKEFGVTGVGVGQGALGAWLARLDADHVFRRGGCDRAGCSGGAQGVMMWEAGLDRGEDIGLIPDCAAQDVEQHGGVGRLIAVRLGLVLADLGGIAAADSEALSHVGELARLKQTACPGFPFGEDLCDVTHAQDLDVQVCEVVDVRVCFHGRTVDGGLLLLTVVDGCWGGGRSGLADALAEDAFASVADALHDLAQTAGELIQLVMISPAVTVLSAP